MAVSKSSSDSAIRVGLIGLGTVGTGVAKILTHEADLIRRRLGVRLDLVRVATRRAANVASIPLPAQIVTADAAAVVADPRVQIVVELIGGEEPARTLILSALKAGKPVVTANKALLALHGEEVFAAAQAAGVDLGFEGSVGGGIPIVKALKEGLAANQIQSIYGIMNGTTNYILTTMARESRPFAEVLEEAKRAGYAEADPTVDVEGLDSAHKLAILVTLAFGTPLSLKQVYTEGITKVTPLDLEYAKAFGYAIKLLAIAKASANGPDAAVEARVHPTMVPADSLLAGVGGVYNAIFVAGHAVGETLFYGLGAGQMPTASAVVADLIDVSRNLLAGSPARVPFASFMPAGRRVLRVKEMDEVRSRYYLRFMVADQPGVLSAISGVLGRHAISIASVIQQGRGGAAAVPVVIMTHEAVERDVRVALDEVNAMPFVAERTVLIRVEAHRQDARAPRERVPQGPVPQGPVQ